MKTVDLNRLPMMEAWHEEETSAKWKANLPFTPYFPLWAGIETDQLSFVYMEVEPGCKLGEHTDSAEELVLVLNGTVEAVVQEETGRLSEGEMLVIPAMAPHEIRNIGEGKARLAGFFAGNQVTSSFKRVVSPMGIKTLGPQVDAQE